MDDRRRHLSACLLASLILCASPAQAENADEPAPADQAQSAARPETQPAATSAKDWEFATIGYVWFAGAHGRTDVVGPAEPVDLDLSFGDVLKAFKFAFMGAAEAKHDRLVILGDLTFIHLDTKRGIGIRDPDFVNGELDSRTAEVTLLGGYRLADKGPVTVDLLAGGRMNFFKVTLQLDGPNNSLDGSKSENWFDPLIAGRVGTSLGGKWSAGIYGDVGGIVTGSDITWQVAPSVDYQINHKMRIGAGWRVFKVHYDKGDFLYDVAQSGPLITFRTAF
jgi:hypothetical protein